MMDDDPEHIKGHEGTAKRQKKTSKLEHIKKMNGGMDGSRNGSKKGRGRDEILNILRGVETTRIPKRIEIPKTQIF